MTNTDNGREINHIVSAGLASALHDAVSSGCFVEMRQGVLLIFSPDKKKKIMEVNCMPKWALEALARRLANVRSAARRKARK